MSYQEYVNQESIMLQSPNTKLSVVDKTLIMDKDISLEVLKCQKNEADYSAASGSDLDHPDGSDPDHPDDISNVPDQVDEDEDNKGVVSIIRKVKVYLTCIYFCLDVMLYLHKELDGKSLLDKTKHIWTDWYWSRKDNMFKKTRNSKGSTAKDIFFLILRYTKKRFCHVCRS